MRARDVAERLDLHVATVYGIIQRGELEASIDSRRGGYEITEVAFDEYIERARVTPTGTST